MKRVTFFLYIVVGSLALWSCASSSKYQQNLQQISSYEKQIKKLKKDSVELANQADELTLMLGNERKEKQDALVESQQLRDLRGQVESKNEQLHLLKATILNSLVYFEMDDLELYVKHGKVYISLSDNLLFGSGSVRVDGEGEEILQHIAKVLKHHPNIHILVEGHTDNVPVRSANSLFRDNWELSTARATSVARILCDNEHIEPERISVVGRGEFAPKVSNATAEGRKINRRTEIILSPKLEELIETVVYNQVNGTNNVASYNNENSFANNQQEVIYTAPRRKKATSNVYTVSNVSEIESNSKKSTFSYKIDQKEVITKEIKQEKWVLDWAIIADYIQKQSVYFVEFIIKNPIWQYIDRQMGQVWFIQTA